MSTVTMIDPPSGWRYGFPRKLPEYVGRSISLEDWLVEVGYPEKDVPLALKYSRYWTAEDEYECSIHNK